MKLEQSVFYLPLKVNKFFHIMRLSKYVLENLLQMLVRIKHNITLEIQLKKFFN